MKKRNIFIDRQAEREAQQRAPTARCDGCDDTAPPCDDCDIGADPCDDCTLSRELACPLCEHNPAPARLAYVMKHDDEHEHYTHGAGVECIEAIRSALGPEQFIGHCRGNIIKYLWRYPLKGGVADLKKAADYLDWLIDAETHRGDS